MKSLIKHLLYISFAFISTTTWAIGPVSLSDNMKLPKEPYIGLPGKDLGLLLDSMIIITDKNGVSRNAKSGKEVDKKHEDEQQSDFANKNIDIEEIIKTALINELKSKGKYDETADEKLETKVLLYGFSTKLGSISKGLPLVSLKVVVKNSAGKKIYKGKGNINVFGNPIPPSNIYDLLDSPELIQQNLEQAAIHAAKLALKKMK